MSRALVTHIRSDLLRQVVRTALDAGFELNPRGSHPKLVCPDCGHAEIFTFTGRQHHHEIKGKISRLRKHGLPWQGQPGVHTAPMIGRQR
jgi:predicted RNA-binding Zn-ribbon protein involved in translation (DUF1610 family)